MAFRMPRSLASRFRIAAYRLWGMRLGAHCRIESIRVRRPSQIEIGCFNAITEGCWLWPHDGPYDGCRIQIGHHNYFNRDVMIDACGRIVVGDHNMVGPRVYMTDSNHRHEPGTWPGQQGMDAGEVRIGNGCWIGAGAIILKDVTLGDRCVVGAGSVVTRSFPAGAVVAGAPARLIRQAT